MLIEKAAYPTFESRTKLIGERFGCNSLNAIFSFGSSSRYGGT